MTRCGRNTIKHSTRFVLLSGVIAGAYTFIEYKNVYISAADFLIACVLAVIFRIVYKKYKYKKYMNCSIGEVDQMTGEEFEEFLAAHFKNSGYRVKLTPITNDYGADLILKKLGEKIVVQAKRWKTSVGIEAVQQVIGSLRYYNAHDALVVTNSTYTKNAAYLAKANNIQLWDRKDLLEFMDKPTVGSDSHTCPECGSSLIIRKGRYGSFLGCSNYPKCRYTKNLKN